MQFLAALQNIMCILLLKLLLKRVALVKLFKIEYLEG